MQIITTNPIVSGNKIINKGNSMDNIDISGIDKEFNAFNGMVVNSPAVQAAATATNNAKASEVAKEKAKKEKLSKNIGKAKNLAQETGLIDFGKNKLQQLFNPSGTPDSSQTKEQEKPKEEKKSNTGKIIGITVGAIALVAVIYFATKGTGTKGTSKK